jgi:hypothetical protein
MSLTHISRSVRTVTSHTFAGKFITLGRVIQYWDSVVSKDLSLQTYPIGMSIRKRTTSSPAKDNKKDNKKASSEGKTASLSPPKRNDIEAVLEIAATSGAAPLIHYQKAMILDRLANLLGGHMVVDIRVVQGGIGTLSPAARAGLMARAQQQGGAGDDGLSHAAEVMAQAYEPSVVDQIGAIEDEELRAVLTRMACSMHEA